MHPEKNAHGTFSNSTRLVNGQRMPRGMLHTQLLTAVWRARPFARYHQQLVGLLQVQRQGLLSVKWVT